MGLGDPLEDKVYSKGRNITNESSHTSVKNGSYLSERRCIGGLHSIRWSLEYLEVLIASDGPHSNQWCL